jgi:hypothetical protein
MLLLLSCGSALLGADEVYQTSGLIYVLNGECGDNGVAFATQYSATHLLGVEVCNTGGCEPSPYYRHRASVVVECTEADDGPEAIVRARFLEISNAN